MTLVSVTTVTAAVGAVGSIIILSGTRRNYSAVSMDDSSTVTPHTASKSGVPVFSAQNWSLGHGMFNAPHPKQSDDTRVDVDDGRDDSGQQFRLGDSDDEGGALPDLHPPPPGPAIGKWIFSLPLLGRVRILKDPTGLVCSLFIIFYWVYGNWSTWLTILLPRYYDGHMSVVLLVCKNVVLESGRERTYLFIQLIYNILS